jgi:hypothetical protein
MLHLELEDLVLAVSELSQLAAQLALVRRAVLVAGDGLVESRGAADEDLEVLLVRRRDDGLEELLGDVALALRPVLRGLVKDVKGAEAVGVLVLELLKFRLEDDVVGGDVAVDERNLGLVLGVLEDGAGELVHGGDSGATSDQSDVVVLVGLPRVLGDGSLHLKRLAGCHVVHVLGHDATGVPLDNEVEVTGSVLVRDRGVWANSGLRHLRALVLGDERAGDVQAGNGILVVQLEPQLLGVVVDDLGGFKGELNEALVASSEALDGSVAGLLGHVGLLCARGGCLGLCGATSSVPVSSSEGGGTSSAVDQAIVAGGFGCFGSVLADVLWNRQSANGSRRIAIGRAQWLAMARLR